MPKSGVTAFLIKELKEVLPPTVFFVVGFNLIVLTTDLILADYLRSFASFLVATMTALVVGKSVLVANAIPLARRFDNRPLIQPVLFKTIFYWVVVFLVRFLEKLVEYLLAGGTFSGVPEYISKHFSWHRFAAIQIWIFVLFLIYNSMVELNAVLGKGELEKLFFTRRSPKTLRNSKSPQQGQRAESREQIFWKTVRVKRTRYLLFPIGVALPAKPTVAPRCGLFSALSFPP